ncbi:GSCFA family protein [Methylobacterium sp. ap11]|uniref:GSCFA domain-containing protein n=1 Tax=Methylobacterium sp. ap11 TaxID=1761799 RepID=UPI0008C8BF61|nr:GSCFA domain-containing protein [Methylobacterium sp. ap11]SEP50589.1 GSCFA family protein [Methylobacterium sp. ap11]
MSQNPYRSLPDYNFWRNLAATPYDEVDLCIGSKFLISQTDKVSTAGSCFAQHIAKRLAASGYTYYITESAHRLVPEDLALENNYGVFSARYGNIYSVAQLLQLFQRSYNIFMPKDDIWIDKNKKFRDPFRPAVEYSGFSSLSEYYKDRERHFYAVRKMFETTDIFVFTLGLTECWASKEDGAVYPICPGVIGGSFDERIHQFENHTVERMMSNMEDFISLLKNVNSKCRIILTVSPVPLAATYENRHVLVSTTYSKSALRVLAEQISIKYEHVEYFPSYEIITGNFNRGKYYAKDLRNVLDSGVDHVMRVFFKNFTQGDIYAPNDTEQKSNKVENSVDIAEKIASAICEESVLGNAVNNI